jgi:hypothetical protein
MWTRHRGAGRNLHRTCAGSARPPGRSAHSAGGQTWLASNHRTLLPFPSRRTPTFLPPPRAAGEDMCSIADLSSAEVRAILKLGHDVKRNPREYRHALDAKQMVLMFEKASLRTRLSFETGINTMGGNAIFVDQTNSPLGERESIADVARNVERWVDVIVLRTYAHDTITEMAANSRVPVINALSDFEHPCQALADFMTSKSTSAPPPDSTSPMSATATTSATR